MIIIAFYAFAIVSGAITLLILCAMAADALRSTKLKDRP